MNKLPFYAILLVLIVFTSCKEESYENSKIREPNSLYVESINGDKFKGHIVKAERLHNEDQIRITATDTSQNMVVELLITPYLMDKETISYVYSSNFKLTVRYIFGDLFNPRYVIYESSDGGGRISFYNQETQIGPLSGTFYGEVYSTSVPSLSISVNSGSFYIDRI